MNSYVIKSQNGNDFILDLYKGGGLVRAHALFVTRDGESQLQSMLDEIMAG